MRLTEAAIVDEFSDALILRFAYNVVFNKITATFPISSVLESVGWRVLDELASGTADETRRLRAKEGKAKQPRKGPKEEFKRSLSLNDQLLFGGEIVVVVCTLFLSNWLGSACEPR